MSETTIESWRAQPLTPELREAAFAAGKSFSGELDAIGRAYRRQVSIMGFAGCLVGLAGMAMAAWEHFQPKPPPAVIEVDTTTGYAKVLPGPNDAPISFNSLAREVSLRGYIEDREAFVPETDNLAFHRAAIKSTPDEQIRLAERHDPKRSPETAPFIVYGRSGFASVSNFHFREEEYDKTTRAYRYVAHFAKTAYKSGEPAIMHAWTADIEFKLEPKLKMDEQDRQINPLGLQVIAYKSYDDTAH